MTTTAIRGSGRSARFVLLAELGLGAPSYNPSGRKPIREIGVIRGKNSFIVPASFRNFRVFRGGLMIKKNQRHQWNPR